MGDAGRGGGFCFVLGRLIMLTRKQQTLINELTDSLHEEEQSTYTEIVNCLVELGYIPQRNRSYISFKHKTNDRIIAKIRNGDIRIKFFACKNPPEKYIDALRVEMNSSDGQYSMSVPNLDCSPTQNGVIMKKCTLLCNVCTGGGMRYYYKFSDGKELFRCGAYPVLIPDVVENDVKELKRLILEQHNYFLSLA